MKSYGIARSPFLSGVVLHLLYECTQPNKRLKLAAPVPNGCGAASPFGVVEFRL